jgi:hypothetical protein
MKAALTAVSLASSLGLLLGFGSVASAGLQNSHHDFTSLTGSGEICKPCHTPHNADTTVDAPLWNHDVTVAAFTVYTSTTMDAVLGQPTGNSKLCLSCHDGSVAIDAFGGQAGTVFISDPFYTGPGDTLDSFFTTDLSADHPISFTYNAALVTSDGALHDPSTTPSGLGATIDEDLLDDGRVECTSCHDPHLGRASGCGSCHFGLETKSLWKSNAGSDLCLTCHDK